MRERERERGVGAVMTDGNVKAESLHNTNSGDTRAFCFLTGVKGTGRENI